VTVPKITVKTLANNVAICATQLNSYSKTQSLRGKELCITVFPVVFRVGGLSKAPQGPLVSEFEKHDAESKEKAVAIIRTRCGLGGMRKAISHLFDGNINVRRWKVGRDP